MALGPAMTPLQFESERAALWQELDTALQQLERGRRRAKAEKNATPGPAAPPPDAARLAALYRMSCEHLALARARAYPSLLIERLELLTERAHQLIYRRAEAGGWRLARLFLVGIPEAVRAHGIYMLVAALVFVVPTVVLGVVTYFDPAFVLTMHDAASVRGYESMYGPGADPIGHERGADTDWQMFGFYVMNNIGVAFRCFAGGLFAGIGSLFFTAYNGALGGTLAGYLTARGHGERFYSFVVTHGAFELTAIVIAAAAGLSLGHALLAPGRASRLQALQRAAREAVPLLYATIVMLLIAAALEAFWSSARWIAPGVKYGVGGACWALVAAYFIWQGRPRDAR